MSITNQREWWGRLSAFLALMAQSAHPENLIHQEAIWLHEHGAFAETGDDRGSPLPTNPITKPVLDPPPISQPFNPNAPPLRENLPYRLAVEVLKPEDVVAMLKGLFGTMSFDETVAQRLRNTGAGHLVGRHLTAASFIDPFHPSGDPS